MTYQPQIQVISEYVDSKTLYNMIKNNCLNCGIKNMIFNFAEAYPLHSDYLH